VLILAALLALSVALFGIGYGLLQLNPRAHQITIALLGLARFHAGRSGRMRDHAWRVMAMHGRYQDGEPLLHIFQTLSS
jgi:hypothetical protein